MTLEGPRRALRRIFKSVFQPMYVSLRRPVADILFEWPNGIETSRVVGLADLGLGAEHRRRYQPSGWLNLPRILPKHEVSENDVFVDFGSGMGRVVYQAARYPFRRVIGVELSEELNAIARKNIQAAGDRPRCKDVELMTSDVLAYEIRDDVTVGYLFNAFTGSIFRTFVDKLIASIERRPRVVRIVYANPIEEALLLAAEAPTTQKGARDATVVSVVLFQLDCPARLGAECARRAGERGRRGGRPVEWTTVVDIGAEKAFLDPLSPRGT